MYLSIDLFIHLSIKLFIFLSIVFENATKPSRFSHFSVDAQSTYHTKRRLNVQNVSETLSF